METLKESMNHRRVQIELEGTLALSDQKLQVCIEENATLRQQVLDQKDELVRHFQDVSHRDSVITRLQDQIRALRTEIQHGETRGASSIKSFDKILASLEDILANPEGDYPEQIRKLIKEHFPNHPISTDLPRETRQQVLAMSRKMTGLINLSDQRDRQARIDMQKRVAENGVLIEEINSLRRANKSLEEEISRLKASQARAKLVRAVSLEKPNAPKIPNEANNALEEQISRLTEDNLKLRMQLFSAQSTLKNFKK